MGRKDQIKQTKSMPSLDGYLLSTIFSFADLTLQPIQDNIPGLEVIKLFSFLTQLSTEFILLINVKMTSVVGILKFISLINTTSERGKARNFYMCQYFSVYEQLCLFACLC